jgi:hypothetical protein
MTIAPDDLQKAVASALAERDVVEAAKLRKVAKKQNRRNMVVGLVFGSIAVGALVGNMMKDQRQANSRGACVAEAIVKGYPESICD